MLVLNSSPYFCTQTATIFQHSDSGTAALSHKIARVLRVVAQLGFHGLRVAITIFCSVYIRIELRFVAHWSLETTRPFIRGVPLHLVRYGQRLDGVMILASRICLFRHGSVIMRMSHVIRQTRFAVISLCCANCTELHSDARGGHLLVLFEFCCAIISDAYILKWNMQLHVSDNVVSKLAVTYSTLPKWYHTVVQLSAPFISSCAGVSGARPPRAKIKTEEN